LAGGARGLGIARTCALILGIAYVGLAVLEILLGSHGLVVGGGVVILLEPVHNVIHWITGVVSLGSFFAGEKAARSVAKVVGIAFLSATILGLVAGELTMGFLGYEGVTSVPISYTILHALTAIGAVYAGFAAREESGSLPKQ
jgi:predicted permease